MRYTPSSAASTVRLWLVAIDVAVTVTPGSTAPVGSVILPVNADVLPDWANSDEAHKTTNVRKIKREQSEFFDFTPPPWDLFYGS
jgi:hypothetical protein